MSFFDQVYQRLFAKKAKGLILHELIKRSQSYLDQYELWKASELPELLLADIHESLELKKQGILKNPEVHQFSGDYSNGIAITYHPDIEKIYFQFLFDLFSEKVQELGYKVSVSDLIVTEKETYLESKEKHYLKIKPVQQAPIDQKYGNVIIELILINDEPSFLRLMAHAYNDRLYKEPENFDELAAYLFTTDNKK